MKKILFNLLWIFFHVLPWFDFPWQGKPFDKK
jgi:hypothetical protein